MTHELDTATELGEITFAYHRRTKHRLERYARGPETLDWDMQPNPFRQYGECERISLPFQALGLNTSFADLYTNEARHPAEPSIESIAALFELSFGLSAWKQYGPDRWALRCNPSSGNLHPTEAYLICRNVVGLADGLYHYCSLDHALELRYRFAPASHPAEPRPAAELRVGLTSIHWREAWKYGERAFRYCQLDLGHAIGALRYATAALGWRAQLVEKLDAAALADLLGVARPEDFSSTETEEADLLVALDPHSHAEPQPDHGQAASTTASSPQNGEWTGRANLLDRRKFYHWPVIDEVAEATRGSPLPQLAAYDSHPALLSQCGTRAATVILKRRSAQNFDAKYIMEGATFFHLMDSLLNRPSVPWDFWAYIPRIHPVFFVHRVKDVEPGLYILPRHAAAEGALREELRSDFLWASVANAPAHVPLRKLVGTDCRAVARTLNCHQAIGRDSCFAVAMLAEFEEIVRPDPWRYRQLHWEAGLVGQVLYLEAEAAGLRGTGIGCYFDDVLHELLGLKTEHFQSLYHFTIGLPLTDERLMTLPAYPGRIDPK
ncbi:MAG TPA: SagB family peptide dehydrogenase [Methylocella sp.]|nr:SagB family peptide dehydrogenase [Methylocella sp.]